MSSEDERVAWLRRQVKGRLALARHAVELGSGVLVTSERDGWDGIHPLSDSSLTRLMEANDPQDTIARCEAELAILREHHILHRGDRSEEWEELSIYMVGDADKDHGCVRCHYYSQGAVKGCGCCQTVRAVASAYRYREGYAEHWGAPAQA